MRVLGSPTRRLRMRWPVRRGRRGRRTRPAIGFSRALLTRCLRGRVPRADGRLDPRGAVHRIRQHGAAHRGALAVRRVHGDRRRPALVRRDAHADPRRPARSPVRAGSLSGPACWCRGRCSRSWRPPHERRPPGIRRQRARRRCAAFPAASRSCSSPCSSPLLHGYTLLLAISNLVALPGVYDLVGIGDAVPWWLLIVGVVAPVRAVRRRRAARASAQPRAPRAAARRLARRDERDRAERRRAGRRVAAGLRRARDRAAALRRSRRGGCRA